MVGQSRLTVGMGASGFLLARNDPQPGVEAAVTTLDRFAEERGLERIDMIKVDIEGHEERMLQGARKTPARAQTHSGPGTHRA